MPVKRRRAKMRREPFTTHHRLQLLQGFDFLGDAYGNPDARPLGRVFDEAAAREDWEEHRDELMAFWLQDPMAWARTNRRSFGNPPPGGSGTRPAAWWWFDAPDDERLVFGLAPINVPSQRAGGVHYCRGVLLESEAAFLRRHGLLVAGELERIPAEAFEPDEKYWPAEARRLEAARGRSA